MNKIILSALGLAALGFVSCDDDSYNDWTKTTEKETYSQESIIELGLKATPSFSTVNMAEVAEGETFSIEVTYSLPANANVAHNIAVAKEEDPATATTFYAEKDGLFTVEGNKIVFTAEQLQTIVTNTFGKAPETRELYLVDKIMYSIGNMTYAPVSVITAKVTVTPTAPVIEEVYYYLGKCNGWDMANCTDEFKFTRKDESVSVYDDPIFTLKIAAPTKEVDGEVVRDDNYFKIAPASAIAAGSWDNVVGCVTDGCTDLTGSLQGGGAILMPASDGALFYEITINMLECTYSIKPISFLEFIYTPGSHNGWDGSKGALQSPNMDGHYAGYVPLGGEWGWKVKDGDTWYGAGAEENTIDAAGGNIDEGSELKFYYLEVDLTTLSFKKTEVTSISIIGNPDTTWGSDVDLTYDAENNYWTVTTDLVAAEFKFRVNHDWALNFGGSFDSLVNDGGNLKVEEAGNYTITLYPTYNGNSHCTIVKN
ncbi:MAG: hypothetical protein Q4C30_10385 [Bacteroidia bacterium]|nr:hypothetical protein [Bacteroidia bacterium]